MCCHWWVIHIHNIPVAIYHVSLPIVCHALFLIKQTTDKTSPPPPAPSKRYIRSCSKRTLPGQHPYFYGWIKKPDNGRVGFLVVEEKISRQLTNCQHKFTRGSHTTEKISKTISWIARYMTITEYIWYILSLSLHPSFPRVMF